jgi:hypothetical protein
MMLEETVARPGRRQGEARVLAAATSSSLPSTRRLLIIYRAPRKMAVSLGGFC